MDSQHRNDCVFAGLRANELESREQKICKINADKI